MSEPVIHLDVSYGLDMRTACNMSTHGWNLKRPKLTTRDPRQTTCKRCLKAVTK